MAIVRALLLQPRIVLLDEPTSAMDRSVQAEILNLLNTLKQRANLTMVQVSHDADVVDYRCACILYAAEKFYQSARLLRQEARIKLNCCLGYSALHMD